VSLRRVINVPARGIGKASWIPPAIDPDAVIADAAMLAAGSGGQFSTIAVGQLVRRR
jgi:hypothetical protein